MNSHDAVSELDYDTLIYGEFPPHKMCFITLVIFNFAHVVFKKRKSDVEDQITMEHFKTFSEAFEISYTKAEILVKQFKGSKLIEIDPNMDSDECHIYVVSKNEEIIAKIGVLDNDYRGEVFH